MLTQLITGTFRLRQELYRSLREAEEKLWRRDENRESIIHRRVTELLSSNPHWKAAR